MRKHFNPQQRLIYFFLSVFLISIFLFFADLSTAAATVSEINFIGSAILPTNASFQQTPVGGLSGITYDTKKDLYYAISDDRSAKAAARFYTFKIDLGKGMLANGDVKPIGVTRLLNDQTQVFESGSIDPEGIALTSRETVFVSSEGDARELISPFIKEFSLSSGKELKTLTLPPKFLPDKNGKRGVRNNLAFESLTITPDEKSLFTATENALIQDGPASQPKISSPCRILRYNLQTNQPSQEFLYLTEPITPFMNFSQRFDSGLTDLLALDNQGHFLSVERTFTGLSFAIALFEVDLEKADDIHKIDSLLAIDSNNIKPVTKKLLLDLRNLDVALDNIEGLTLGAKLPNGKQSLLLISDNNFNNLQRTQILAFELKMESPLLRLFRRLLPQFNR